MQALATLNKYFFKYKWRLIGGVLFIVLSNYFRILSPQVTGYVINSVVQPTEKITGKEISNYNFLVRAMIGYFDKSTFGQKILLAGVVLLVLAIISGFFMFLMRQTIIVMSRHIEFDQKNEIFAHYQQLDALFYKRNTIGDLMNRISEDVSRVRSYTGPAVMYFINLAAVIGFSIYFMWRSDARLTLIALAPLPFLAITIYLVNSVINRKSEKVQQMLSALTTNAQESYSGIRVIKSFVQEKANIIFFRKNSQTYKDNALSLAKTEAIYFPAMALMIGLSTILTIMVGALEVVNGNATVGKIAEFVMYIQMMTFPVSAIGWTASMTQRAATSQRRINEFLFSKPAIASPENAVDREWEGTIDFSKVNFTYPDTGIKALVDFNLQIKKGEKVAVIGRTGSGKTTLAQLLLRFYDVNTGSIKIDDTDVRNINLDGLRNQVAYVPQEAFLFSDTVENNIRFGEQGTGFEDVKKAARQAVIDREIESFPNGYQTIVGERGVTLSGGQKQRISIARGLIKKPSMVIFDDCLSAVDANTEKEIVNNLKEYLQNRTAIIITHRIFSLFQFDKIVVMEAGKIAELGTHAELMKLNGLYAKLYHHQSMTESKN